MQSLKFAGFSENSSGLFYVIQETGVTTLNPQLRSNDNTISPVMTRIDIHFVDLVTFLSHTFQ